VILSTAGVYQKMFAIGIRWKCVVRVSLCVWVCECVCTTYTGWLIG